MKLTFPKQLLLSMLTAIAIGGSAGLLLSPLPAPAQLEPKCTDNTGCILNQCTGDFQGYFCIGDDGGGVCAGGTGRCPPE